MNPLLIEALGLERAAHPIVQVGPAKEKRAPRRRPRVAVRLGEALIHLGASLAFGRPDPSIASFKGERRWARS